MRTKLLASVVGLALIAFSALQSVSAPPISGAGDPQATPDESKSDIYMRRKLRFSQEVFAGLARTDLAAVASASKSMNALNWFEQVTHGKDAEYQRHLKSYQLASKKLQVKAEANDLDGATLAFMELTLSCVNCHKNVRENSLSKPSIQAPSNGTSR